jgi:hypothetical protein
MEMPNVPHRVEDPKRKIILTIWAYRKLSRDEVAMCAKTFCRMHKLKRGKHYDVYTVIH